MMMKTTRTGPLLVAGVFLCTLGLPSLAISGCGEEAQAPAPAASYTTQGRVVMVKTPDSPASSLKIHHEAIPNFVDGQGQVVGMPSHPMDFPRVADTIDVDSLVVGRAVRFTFDVTWDPSPSWIITELEFLPDETRFAFEQPAAADEAEPDSSGGAR